MNDAIIIDDNDELTAERILEERFNEDNQLQYLIKWEGEEEEYATWESYDEVSQSWPHLLDEFTHNTRKHKKEIIVLDQDHEYSSYYNHQQLTEYDIPSHSSTSTTSTTTLSPNIRYKSSSSRLSVMSDRYNTISPHPQSNAPLHHRQSVIKPSTNVYVKSEPITEYSCTNMHSNTVVTQPVEIEPTEPITPSPTASKLDKATSSTLRLKQELTQQIINTNYVLLETQDNTTSNIISNESNSNTISNKQTIVMDLDETGDEIKEEESDVETVTVYTPTLQLDFDVHYNEIAQDALEETVDDTISEDTVHDAVHHDNSTIENNDEPQSNNIDDKLDETPILQMECDEPKAPQTDTALSNDETQSISNESSKTEHQSTNNEEYNQPEETQKHMEPSIQMDVEDHSDHVSSTEHDIETKEEEEVNTEPQKAADSFEIDNKQSNNDTEHKTIDDAKEEDNDITKKETVNQHNSESDTESDNINNDSDQAQPPSITQLTHAPIKTDDNVNISTPNSNTSSPTSSASPSTNQFQDHLPSLSNPSMTDPPPNPSVVPPHYLASQHPLNAPNNNNIRKHQPPNQQYTLLHFGQQPTFAPHELNSFHSLYIPPSAHHHIDSNMDSNSEYNHQSIHTDSTNSTQQTQTHCTVHSTTNQTSNISITTNPPNPPPPHGIFMPSINPTHNLPPLSSGLNGSSQQPPPPPLPPIHQLAHFSTVPIPMTRIPLPMPGSGPPPPSSQHPVLLSPANNNGNTVTPPTSSYSNNITFESQSTNDYNENNTYYNDANSINSHYYNNADNFQNVDFQQIKANGAPYNCPFCDTLSFQLWADWKQHWYQLHNKQYFDDAQKNINNQHKTRSNKVNNKIDFQSTMLSSLKSFPPQPTNMVFSPSDSIQFQLQNVNLRGRAQKRNHESMTNAQEDDFAPKAKRQKTSHSSYNKHKKKDDDEYVVSHDEDEDDEDDQDDDDEDDDDDDDDDDVSSSDSDSDHKKRKHRHHRSIKKKVKSKKSKRKSMSMEKKKRGRGRPRKHESKAKRKRGRPKKHSDRTMADGESLYSPKSTRSKRQKLNGDDPLKYGTKLAICCKICNVNCTNNAGLSNHIRARHGLSKLQDYYLMSGRAIKAKQNEMHYNDANLLIGISPTHKSKNIKYKYRCTLCKDKIKLCAGHVGLNSHLRAHVKNGDLSDNEQKKLYKEIMKHPIPINAETNNNCEPIKQKASFKNEVIGDEEESSSDEHNKGKEESVAFTMPIIRLPHKQSENTPPCSLSPQHNKTKKNITTNDDDDDDDGEDDHKRELRAKPDESKKGNLDNIGRIPKKTPEQQKQQQMFEQSNILYPQRQKREFSPPDSPSPQEKTYTKSKYINRKNHYSSDNRSHSRSSSSSHSTHSRNYRDGKYRRNNKNRRSKYNGNIRNHYYQNKKTNNNNNNMANPLYPDNYGPYRSHKMNTDDHHNVPALQPLHSPKHPHKKRHYYDNRKVMAHYKYINNDGSINDRDNNGIYDENEVKTPSSANSGTTTDDI